MKSLTHLSLVILFSLSNTQAAQFLLLCELTPEEAFTKIGLTDYGNYFLLEGLTKERKWEQITYFPEIIFTSKKNLSFKSEDEWPCEIGTCYRNEYFNYIDGYLSYSKHMKTLNYSSNENYTSSLCRFDFPNK